MIRRPPETDLVIVLTQLERAIHVHVFFCTRKSSKVLVIMDANPKEGAQLHSYRSRSRGIEVFPTVPGVKYRC